MIAVIYMANTISTNWNGMLVPFNISMLVMLLTVVCLYYIQYRNEKNRNSASHNSLQILSIVCTIYVIALIAILFNMSHYVIWIDVVAVITGAFLPFSLRETSTKASSTSLILLRDSSF